MKPWAVPIPLQGAKSANHPSLTTGGQSSPLQAPHSLKNYQTFQEVSWTAAKASH